MNWILGKRLQLSLADSPEVSRANHPMLEEPLGRNQGTGPTDGLLVQPKAVVPPSTQVLRDCLKNNASGGCQVSKQHAVLFCSSAALGFSVAVEALAMAWYPNVEDPNLHWISPVLTIVMALILFFWGKKARELRVFSRCC